MHCGLPDAIRDIDGTPIDAYQSKIIIGRDWIMKTTGRAPGILHAATGIRASSADKRGDFYRPASSMTDRLEIRQRAV